MTAAKTKPTKCEVRAVLWFLAAKHYLAAAICQENFSVYRPVSQPNL